jgi:hypothetical protein
MIVKKRYVKVTAANLSLFGDPQRYEVVPMFEGMAPELWELQEVECDDPMISDETEEVDLEKLVAEYYPGQKEGGNGSHGTES